MIDHKCIALTRHWSHMNRVVITWCAHIYDFVRKKTRECRVLEHIPATKFKFTGKAFGELYFLSLERDMH